MAMTKSILPIISLLLVISTCSESLITYTEFSEAMTINGYSIPSKKTYESFMKSMHFGKISSKTEAAMALSQILYESNGLASKSEPECSKNGCPGQYVDPTCDIPPNNYYGRGYLQMTWCVNYKNVSEFLGLGTLLVENPDLVAQSEDLSWTTAFWFWKENVHDVDGVQEGQFGTSTLVINGAECYDSGPLANYSPRFKIYANIFNVFGLPGQPNPKGCSYV